MITKGPAIH